VGYGDQYIASEAGRLWASIHIYLSVILLANLLSTLTTVISARDEVLKRHRQMTRRLDEKFVAGLLARGKKIREKEYGASKRSESDDGSLVLQEFVITMLLELGVVGWEQVAPLIRRFQRLDVDGSGSLDPHDLAMMNAWNDTVLRRKPTEVQIQNHAAAAAAESSSAAPEAVHAELDAPVTPIETAHT